MLELTRLSSNPMGSHTNFELPSDLKIHNVLRVSLFNWLHPDNKFGHHVNVLEKGVDPFP